MPVPAVQYISIGGKIEKS